MMIISKRLSKLQFRRLLSNGFDAHVTKKYELQPDVSFDETLTGRLYIYLNRRNNKLKPATTQVIINTQDILSKINNFNIDELENSVLNWQSDDKIQVHKKQLINSLDSISCLKLTLLTTSEILKLLGILMLISQNLVVNCKFYNLAINQLNNNMLSLSKNELLKVLFFLALKKKNKHTKSLIRPFLNRLESNIEHLTIEDVCIICNSTFKTSTKITNACLLNKTKQIIADNLHILNDPGLFITLIKTIRHNLYQDENTLSTISCAFCFNKTYKSYSFGGLCHVLALYADYFYFDEQLFDVTVVTCVGLINVSNTMQRGIPASKHITRRLRNKDITRLLWALSNVNYKLSKSDYEDISREIMDRILLNEYTKESEELVACALYFWMLKYEALDIIKYYFREKYEEIDLNSRHRVRANLLLTCIRRENPHLYSEINVTPLDLPILPESVIKQQSIKRPSLQRVLNALMTIQPSLSLNKFEYTCEIPYLNIVGITGFKNHIYKTVYIEVFDEYNTLKNTEHLENGPLALKMRLLNRMDDAVLKVEKRIIASMTEKQLEDYLKSQIKLLC